MPAKVLKPSPYLRIKKTKIDTLFKAQTRKMTPYSRRREAMGDDQITAIRTRQNTNLYKIALLLVERIVWHLF